MDIKGKRLLVLQKELTNKLGKRNGGETIYRILEVERNWTADKTIWLFCCRHDDAKRVAHILPADFELIQNIN